MTIRKSPTGTYYFNSENRTEENLLSILAKEYAKNKKIFFSKINKGEITIKIIEK